MYCTHNHPISRLLKIFLLYCSVLCAMCVVLVWSKFHMLSWPVSKLFLKQSALYSLYLTACVDLPYDPFCKITLVTLITFKEIHSLHLSLWSSYILTPIPIRFNDAFTYMQVQRYFHQWKWWWRRCLWSPEIVALVVVCEVIRWR